jgi:glycosyltransferase involved in cell wall biosynthesis
VNSWYLLWLLPFAVGRNEIWPFAAAAALPFSYMTGLNLDDPGLEAFAVHPLARAIEWTILLFAVLYDWRAIRKGKQASRRYLGPASALTKIAVIMPALNEEASVGGVVSGIKAALRGKLQQVIVVDNGSTDRTAAVAQTAGAIIVVEAQRGYGAACLAGIAVLDEDIDIVLFLDSDGSDVLEDAPKSVAHIIEGKADLVIGSRSQGLVERGAMTTPQRFGNWLAPLLVRIIWGVRYTDLGPFRAIRRSSLDALVMQDRDFGWTIEMQVRAAKQGLRTLETPTGYRRRIGISKISGTIDGVMKAGIKILYVIGREAFGDFDSANRKRTRGIR